MAWEDRIVIDPEVRAGKPCIRGTRITVYDVLDYLAGGMTEEQLLQEFPSLTRDDIRASVAFAAGRTGQLKGVAKSAASDQALFSTGAAWDRE